MQEKDPLNVIITGVGGQGNVLISQLIGKALVKEGHHVTIGETYGASQRGGAVMSHLRISRREQYGPVHFHVPEGESSVPVAFGTDAPHLTHWGTPLLIGPGSIDLAHTDDERIEVSEIVLTSP